MQRTNKLSRKQTIIRIVVMFLFTIAAQNLQASDEHAPTIASITDATTSIHLGTHLRYIEDVDGQWSLDEVLTRKDEFRKSESDTPSFGFTYSTYWLFTEVHNAGGQARDLILELDYPHHDTITLFKEKGGVWGAGVTTGDTLNFNQRPIQHHNFLFPLSLQPGEHVRIAMRIKSTGSIQVPLILWDQATFYNFDSNRQLVFGIFFGIFFIMGLYNLFLYFSVKESSYLLYVGYVISLTLYQASYTGFSYKYLWPNHSEWQHSAFPFFVALFAGFSCLFSISFLELQERSRKMYGASLIVTGLCVICCVLAFVIPYGPAMRIATANAILVAALLLTIGIYSWKSGLDQARYYCIAWATFLLGIFGFVFSKFGILPRIFITENGMQIGAAMEVILLSLALGHRLKLLKEENVIALEAAQESNRLKNDFLANISHELRTPLNAILNVPKILLDRYSRKSRWRCQTCNALFEDSKLHPNETPETSPVCPDCSAPMNLERQLRLEKNNPERDHELLEDCYIAAKHFNLVIADLLDYTKLEAGKLELSYEAVDPQKIIDDVCQTFRHVAAEKGIELDIVIPASAESIEADSVKLSQILFNLIGNAVKFTHEGQVSVSVTRSQQASDSLCFTVTDTGIGIPNEALALIFESFRQVDGSHTRKYGGSGLGLSITQKLVNLHGGKIEVESQIGHGSMFRVTLPRTIGTAVVQEQTQGPSL